MSPASLSEDVSNYISMPDLSAVEGVPNKYWVITGDIVSEMSQAEKDTVDVTILDAQRDAMVNAAIDNLESDLRQIVKLMVQEINILRAEHDLPDRTLAQLKTVLRNSYGS